MTSYPIFKPCIDACLSCASICNFCSFACTEEENVKMMVKCIQLTMECAVICYAVAQMLSLGSTKTKAICRLCATLCESCANECAKHQLNHCQECAVLCRQCAVECRNMIA